MGAGTSASTCPPPAQVVGGGYAVAGTRPGGRRVRRWAGCGIYAAYHLIALRGLRRGEAAGLRWCDVDLDGGVATINQQLQQYDGRMVVGPPAAVPPRFRPGRRG